jgi:MFS family permease
VVFTNAAQTVLPELVPTDLLHKANGQQYAIQTAGQLFVGPPVGSLLFGVAVGLPFGMDAASFAISAALLATLPRTRRAAVRHPPMRSAIAEGLRYLTGNRLLRTLALLLGVNNFCGQFGTSTLVLFATETLHVSPRGYGLVLTGTAVGAVAGGLVNARLVAAVGERAATLTALFGMALAYLATGLVPDAVLLGVVMAANGFLVTLWNIVTVSLRQELVPREILGRVNSVYRMLGWGFMPLGALAGGLVAHSLGLRAPYLVASAIRLVAVLVAVPTLLAALSAARAPRDAADRPA